MPRSVNMRRMILSGEEKCKKREKVLRWLYGVKCGWLEKGRICNRNRGK